MLPENPYVQEDPFDAFVSTTPFAFTFLTTFFKKVDSATKDGVFAMDRLEESLNTPKWKEALQNGDMSDLLVKF